MGFVSDDFKLERLLNEMLQSLGERNAETTNREELVRRLQERMKGKRCLLVLDDIWNENREKWDCMRKCLLEIGASQGSKILATTRSHVVASVMQTSSSHELGFLSDDHSCILFEKIAFANGGARKTPKLEDIGRRILKRCGGVPLAIKAISGLLYSMKDELEWSMIEKSEIWSTADGVFSALKLSYEHLPSLSLKQCFASCFIFPKDTRMEKEELIQIWMAQGLINHSKGGGHLQMEDIGSNYFNILMRSSLLQDPKRDEYNNIVSCKMHDLVHDFSLKMSNNYLFDTEDGLVINNDAEVLHLNLILHEGKMLKNVERIPPKLRTLYLEVENYAVLEDLLKRFKYLYVLKVVRYDVTHLPNAVGEMKHLRHLDISQTNIATLPDYITKLYNLTTLRVTYDLKNIPKGFVNLINFKDFSCPAKYFQNKHIFCLPGIGQLSNLQRWPLFAVSQDKGCQIEELGWLHNLKGEIRICRLENVSSYESATKANLFGKSSIQSLELAWDHKTEEDGEDNIDVMEGLQPHSNLKGLTIVGFKGSKFPSWMVDLRNLVKIELKLLACEQVPSLGHLPCLQILWMSGLGNVKRIGSEFYGREILDSARNSSSCSSEGAPITLFPALRSLALLFMDSLVEWSHDGMMISSDSSKVFPNLRDLYLHNLPKLAILPDMCSLTSLHQLKIQSCKSLSRSRNLNSLTSLKSLLITDCPNLDETLNMDNPQSINVLHLSGCDKLIPSLCSLDNFTSLKYLIIESYAEFWPKDLHHPPNLWKLVLGGLYDKDRHDFDFFPWPFSSTNVATTRKDGQQHFMPLGDLKLIGWPKIKSLPEQIQHLSALTSLYILQFDGLKALPEWLGNFRNLEYLRVESCSNLEQLHSVEAMQRLTNLRRLDINYCPRLAARCTRGSGAEWPKIAYIPHLFIM
ncbi:hypothetical protein ACH5RR_028492 [Cinchona calisaya]|uniref:NB-ARC domain-containing protein n=1 Tax=Cinchona calisaya TaxID=153742 RepID=A0ABD2YNY1_9GENT